jgi:hypothetical protein
VDSVPDKIYLLLQALGLLGTHEGSKAVAKLGFYMPEKTGAARLPEGKFKVKDLKDGMRGVDITLTILIRAEKRCDTNYFLAADDTGAVILELRNDALEDFHTPVDVEVKNGWVEKRTRVFGRGVTHLLIFPSGSIKKLGICLNAQIDRI